MKKYLTKLIETGLYVNDEGKKLEYFGDTEKLANEIERQANEMYTNGYELISIFPVLRGNEKHYADSGAGWSVTDGVIITYVNNRS